MSSGHDNFALVPITPTDEPLDPDLENLAVRPKRTRSADSNDNRLTVDLFDLKSNEQRTTKEIES